MKIDLREKIDLRKVEIGTVVISMKGFEFELIERVKGKESWKDLTSNLIWYDIEDEKYTYDQAIEKFKDRIPTIEQFKEAELHGFRDILPNMNWYFWSSSVYSNDSRVAWEFFGYYGNVYNDFRDFVDSVRCVGLAGR